MLRKIAKAISVSVLAFAFLAAIGVVVESSQPFQACVKEIYYNPATENFEKSISSFSAVLAIYRDCLGDFTHDNAEAIIAAFTIILSFSTIYLWLATRDLVTGSERTTRQQLRAYVFFGKGHIKLVTANGQQFIAAETRFKNFGQTPAYKFKSWVAINLCESSAQPFGGKADGATESVIGPGGAIDSNVFRQAPLLPSDIDDIKNGVKTIFLWGRLEYIDAFKEPQSYSFYSTNGDEIPGVGWSIRTSAKPHEAT